MSNDYANAWDALCEAIGAAYLDGPRLGYFDQQEHLTVDQRIEVAKVAALLSISQELSLIQDRGINPDWSQRGT